MFIDLRKWIEILILDILKLTVLGKEYIKAVCCHPASLISMQSTSWEMQAV